MINDKTDEVIDELFQSTSFKITNWVGNINER